MGNNHELADPQIIQTMRDFFTAEHTVKFAYMFGSMARKDAGPLSDLDIAVYLDGRVDPFFHRLKLIEALAKKLRSERFDLVVLNRAPLVLQFEVIKNRCILKEDRSRRIMYEIRVQQEYLDSAYLRRIQYEALKKNLQRSQIYG